MLVYPIRHSLEEHGKGINETTLEKGELTKLPSISKYKIKGKGQLLG
jgi:hypothetical protein